MSFGRAFQRSTMFAGSESQHPAHSPAKKADESEEKQQQQQTEAEGEWSDTLSFYRPPPPNKYSIDTSPAAMAKLARLRDAASLRHMGARGGAAIDRSYAAAHAQPFHSLRPSRPACWESALGDASVPLHRLALAGVHRPDLAREHRQHECEQAARDAEDRQAAKERAFMFREAQIGAMHARKRERVELEQRAALRPQTQAVNGDGSHALVDGSSSSSSSDSAPGVSTLDEPQFTSLSVAPPPRPHWNGAHHLGRELTRRPWATSPARALRAVEAIEAKARAEEAQQRADREQAKARIAEVRQADERLRLENQRRDALIHDHILRHVERAPQNLDAHLHYLLSARCAPRPHHSLPSSHAATSRSLPPHRPSHVHGQGHAGWTSLRHKITYPAHSGSSSARPLPPSSEQARRGSSRRQSRHEYVVGAAATAGSSRMSHSARSSSTDDYSSCPSARTPASVAHAAQVLHAANEGTGLDALAISVSASASTAAVQSDSASNSPRRYSTGAVQPSPHFKAQFAATVAAAHKEAEQGQHSRPTSSPYSSVRGSSVSAIPPPLVSPRSNSRLGTLLSPSAPPAASPRTEELARPLARLQHVKELDRTHRDFRGLVEHIPKEEQPHRGSSRERMRGRPTAAQPAAPVEPSAPLPSSVRPPSALSSRPSTARSRFVRESRAAPAMPAPQYDEQDWALPASSPPPHAAPMPAPLPIVPARPGTVPVFIPRSTLAVATSHPIAPSPRGDALQHPSDRDPTPLWRRDNRLQHAIGSLHE